MASTPNYWDYLRITELLNLQGGIEDDEHALAPDELHFIVVHQTFELWFKMVLRELRLARDHLAPQQVPEEHIPYVVHHLRRVGTILQLAVGQFGVMETLIPQDFLGFREKITPASGFQSYQMREIEIVLGLEAHQRLKYGQTDPLDHIRKMAQETPSGVMAWKKIERALHEPSVRQTLHDWLYRTPIHGSSPEDPDDEQVVCTFLDDYTEAVEATHQRQANRFKGDRTIDVSEVDARYKLQTQMVRDFLYATDCEEEHRTRTRRIRAALVFIESYRELPLLAWPRLLLDTLVEVEEQLVLFRSRHARMVERTIGRRPGTGGSSGVDYLDATTKVRVFTELWAVRTLLLPKNDLPPLKNADFYGFR